MSILVVDDEQSVRSLVRRLLGDEYIVLEAANGKEAVDVARQYKPDLILMDILMPDMSGYAALRAIKTNPVTKGVPVVMLTGLGTEFDKELAEQMGADGYITKPFSLPDLKKIIGRLLKSSGRK
jgi:CheY-like chemotaxis protein